MLVQLLVLLLEECQVDSLDTLQQHQPIQEWVELELHSTLQAALVTTAVPPEEVQQLAANPHMHLTAPLHIACSSAAAELLATSQVVQQE